MSKRKVTTRKKSFTSDAILVLNETRKKELRQSRDYKKTRKILDNMFVNIAKLRTKAGPTLPSEYVFHTEYPIFKKNCREMWRKWKEAQRISRILRELKTEVRYPNDELKSMANMLAYLGLVESLGVTMMDMMLLFLMAHGRELHTRGYPTKHVETFEELEKVWNLDYKLSFLNSSGLSIFKKKIVDTKTRNIIAHLNFTIEKNTGVIRGRRNKIIDINEKISNFWEGIDTLDLVLEDIGFLGWLKQKVLGYESESLG